MAEVAWRQLRSRSPSLPHALLIHGRSGLGKTVLARLFAKKMLCESTADIDLPCGRCPACRWIRAGQSPGLPRPRARRAGRRERERHRAPKARRRVSKPSDPDRSGARDAGFSCRRHSSGGLASDRCPARRGDEQRHRQRAAEEPGGAAAAHAVSARVERTRASAADRQEPLPAGRRSLPHPWHQPSRGCAPRA